MTVFKKNTKADPAFSNFLFILIFTLLGVFLRVLYLQKTDFIINDGGMFYTMILDLQKNNYFLPLFTSYNHSQIPFAYPPLSFYSGAVLNQFLQIDLITIFRFYPLFFNILSIPAVYFLAREITRSNRQALLSTGFYAILLPGYEWLISGGGLTRSPAHTLFIIAFTLFLVYLRNRQRKYLILSVVAAALMTLHHIEYCWMLAFSMILFSIPTLKFREGLATGLLYLIGVGVLTAPYWAVVVAAHGLSPFLSAFSAGEFDLQTTIIRLLVLVFTEESLVTYINVLAIIGMLYCLFAGKPKLVIWLVLISLLNPRSANRSLVFPVAMLAAVAIDQLFCPILDQLWQKQHSGGDSENLPKKHRVREDAYSTVFMLFSIGFPFFLGFVNSFSVQPALTSLTGPEIEAMAWVKNNTPAESTFVVISPSQDWSADMAGEWFPALTSRTSLTTVQGTEWLPESTYKEKRRSYDDFKKCKEADASCPSTWSQANRIDHNYLFITGGNGSKSTAAGLNCLRQSVAASRDYRLVYENDTVSIFQKK